MDAGRLMMHATVGGRKVAVFSPSVELRCPRVFGGGIAMAGVLVAVVDNLLVVQVHLAGGRNRDEAFAQFGRFVLLVLQRWRRIGRVVMRWRRWLLLLLLVLGMGGMGGRGQRLWR